MRSELPSWEQTRRVRRFTGQDGKVTATKHKRELYSPSPVFYGVVALTVVFGVLLAQDIRWGGVTMFLFVVSGWVLSLALHEFGHAVTAFIGGDRSVVAKGYLTLDVRKYADVRTSLLFPIFILIIGGIGLPGGAVWINTGAIRSPVMRSLMSAAGPAASGLVALICLVPIRLGLVTAPWLVIGLAFLGWIQVIAMVFNLLPVPGLDGFGIIEPWLSDETRRAIRPYAQYGILVIIGLIWFVDPVQEAFFDFTDSVTEAIAGPDALGLRSLGWFEFRFWENR